MTFDWTKHKQANGQWVTFDNPDDKIIGTIVNIREHTFDADKGPVPVLDLDIGAEETVSLSCAAVNLRHLVAELEPQVGDRIGVKFTGTTRLPGRPQPMKNFDVRILEKGAPAVETVPEPEYPDESPF